MAFFGRDSEADLQRIERVKAWTNARSPFAVISVAAGVVSVVDCWTLILGVIAGVAAIVLGFAGLREIDRNPALLGRGLCLTGISLGALGLILSLAMWLWIFPALRD